MFKEFLPIAACDNHHHIEEREAVEDTVETYRQLLDFFGYDRILLLGIPDIAEPNSIPDPLNSMKALYVKHRLNPRVYAFSGIQHYYDERDTAEEFLSQAKRAWEMGFDGFKLFNQKPGMRKKTGIAFDSEIFDPMYSFFEENNIPITLHCADPASHWDLNAPNKAELIRRGWLFDETYATRHQLFEEVEGAMRKHPKMRLCIAHLMCDYEDVKCATHFLADYPNTGYDLTACASEYAIASKDPEAWREFFLRFADRLHYGTDMRNTRPGESGVPRAWGVTSALLSHKYLEATEPFEFNGETYIPLCLPRDVVERIYRGNFFTRLGETPRHINREKALIECERLQKAVADNLYNVPFGEYEEIETQNAADLVKGFAE